MTLVERRLLLLVGCRTSSVRRACNVREHRRRSMHPAVRGRRQRARRESESVCQHQQALLGAPLHGST